MGKSDYVKQMQEKEQEAFKKIAEIAESFEDDPKNIAEYLAFSARFYTYSPRNVMLISKQNPGATFVDSYAGWQKRGAHVLKGQHGLNVLVPTKVTYLLDGENWVQLSKATEEQKKLAKLGVIETKQKMFFKVGTVFDISQTDFPKEQYPSLFYMGYNSEQHERICQGVSEYSKNELHCEVRISDMNSIAVSGRYVKTTPPVIELNERLESTQKLSTLTHELGHALLHGGWFTEASTAQKEFEADAFSIMLSANYGIELTESRKRHLADNVSMFKAEVLRGLGEDCTEVQRIWNESLYKSFNSVFEVYGKNIEQIEKYVENHISKEEIISVEDTIDTRFQLDMKKEQVTEMALFCMNNEGVPELDRFLDTISENLGVESSQKVM